MDFLLDPLSYDFLRRALLAGVAVGAAGGLLGLFVVQRGLSFLTDGLAHATFGGLALGLLLGTSVDQSFAVALPFVVLVALGTSLVRKRSGLGPDVSTGVFYAMAFALGIVCLGLRPATATPVDVESLLFGSLLAVSPAGLASILVVAVVTVGTLLALWSRLAYATFDSELAALSGVRVAQVEYTLMALVAVVVVAGLRSVGVVLVSAFVILPAATAHLLARRLVPIALLSMGLAVFATAVGLLLSYHLNLASGATIVLLLGTLFFAALASRRGQAP